MDKQFVIKLVEGAEKGSKITQRVEVKVGIRKPGKVEILEGLSEGDEVVTAGQQRVQKDGTAVKVVELGRGAGAGGSGGAAVRVDQVQVVHQAIYPLPQHRHQRHLLMRQKHLQISKETHQATHQESR
ncbi:MAG: hypothetical protein V9E91_06015 [Burkholderiaceae bacterium]